MLRMTAIAALMSATPALAIAQGMSGNTGTMTDSDMDNIVRTSEITDAEVYTLQPDYDMGIWDETDYYDTVETEWDQIGNVTDVALSPDGQITGIIVETGGFLDIGDSHVVLSLADDVKLASMDGDADFAFVTPLSEEELQDLPQVGENWW